MVRIFRKKKEAKRRKKKLLEECFNWFAFVFVPATLTCSYRSSLRIGSYPTRPRSCCNFIVVLIRVERYSALVFFSIIVKRETIQSAADRETHDEPSRQRNFVLLSFVCRVLFSKEEHTQNKRTWSILAKRSLCSSRTSVYVSVKEGEKRVSVIAHTETRKNARDDLRFAREKNTTFSGRSTSHTKKYHYLRWWSNSTVGWFPLGTRTFRFLLLPPWW